MVREDTLMIKRKYGYFHRVLFDDRFDLFAVLVYDEDSDEYLQLFDDERLIDYRFHTMCMHNKMMYLWRNYISTRYAIVKRHEKKKTDLKRKAYCTILRPFFIPELTEIIVEFIC